MKAPSPFWALWGWPIALAALTATGLVSALVSETWGDWWSWLALGLPTLVMAWHAWPRKHTRSPRDDSP